MLSPEATEMEGSSWRTVKVSIARNSVSMHALLSMHLDPFHFLEMEERSVIPRKGTAKDALSSHVLALLLRSAMLYACLGRPSLQLSLLNAPASWCF